MLTVLEFWVNCFANPSCLAN
uniref:Uncharacterized protein n=1 Tax=Anguilla anguilla TaxID=7936 RepID=A0A0E9VDQ3_ANGAN